tara:strand:+ start:258 stop:968 length:711 start_codon:yes stop_codon:yes gene_type:complete
MAVILKDGTIFLHVPKTGGNWVTTVLERCGLIRGYIGHKHANVDRLLAPVVPNGRRPVRYFNGRRPASYFRIRRIRKCLSPKPFMFCFVRHPLSWYESYFKYMSDPIRQWGDWGDEKDMFDWHPKAALNGCGDSNFGTFVRKAIAKRPGYVTELFGSFAQPQVDFVGTQENLRQDLMKVLRMLRLDFDEDLVENSDPVGVSHPPPGQVVEWEPRLRKEVLQLERVALVRYGYLPPQ